jgi:hypothetical protein
MEKSFEEAIKRNISWISMSTFLSASMTFAFFVHGHPVSDPKVLTELQGIRQELAAIKSQDDPYLTYDKLFLGHYKVTKVINEYDGTALIEGPEVRRDGCPNERIVREMPLGLMAEGKEFDIDGRYFQR